MEHDVDSVMRVAIVDDYAVVVAGIAALLADERIEVIETAVSLPVVTDVDIVLYDTFGQVQGDCLDLEDFVRDNGAKVVIYSWNVESELIARAMEAGASGYLSKALTGAEVVQALQRIMDSETIVLPGDDQTSVDGAGDWPGKAVGLSPREAEVIALITQGLSNQDIADRAYVTINSVKTFVRSAYRKMGVGTRPQAILWGVANGFLPDTERIINIARRTRPETSPPADR